MIAVTAPTGGSVPNERNEMRASKSQPTTMAAPANSDTGITRRWS